MSFDKDKENGINNNYYTQSLHQMYNSPFNSTSPATSPSMAYYNTNNGTNTPTIANRFLQPTTTTTNAAPDSPLARQLSYAQISRSGSSPHHHARAAAAMARNTPASSTVVISDPNDPSKSFNNTAKDKDTTSHWSSLDMGGMGLKNMCPTLCNHYQFLTALYINHNNLTTLLPNLSKLTQLKILDASGNKLNVIPVEIGLLYNLRELLLFDNNLMTVPTELGNLYQLEILGLEGNPLSNDIKNLFLEGTTQNFIMSLRENAPVGLPPPHREWIMIHEDKTEKEEEEEENNKFTLICYNILCQKYATTQLYGYTPSWALNWEYRKELILNELTNYNADVICLQEMEMGQYLDYFKDFFKKLNYDSLFFPKTRAKTMSEKERRVVDGCATFYKTTKFKLLKHEVIEFNQKALQRSDFKQTADIYNRIMNKDNIAVFSLLQDIHTNQKLLVSNCHLHWDPNDPDVKLVQTGILMDELKKFHSNNTTPTIICGDFNSQPDSAVYEYFSKGTVSNNHKDFGNYSYGNYTQDGLSHNYSFKSTYSHLGELPFTNYTPSFKGVLHYIWYSTNTLDVLSLLGPIDQDYLQNVIGFPHPHFPSDHIPIMAELKFKSLTNSSSSHKEPDFNSFHTNNNRIK